VVALVILLAGGLIALGLWSWLAPRAGAQGAGGPRRGSGRARTRDSNGPLGLRSARAITEEREALEAEDLAQMLEAHNAWRRRRGRPERTMQDVELLVAGEAREMRRGREARLAESELDQLLEATNARRRARGLPERDREEVRRSYGQDAPD
jgi:uncharacterized protein YkwD